MKFSRPLFLKRSIMASPKLSTTLQLIKSGVAPAFDSRTRILHLYRHCQKQVPYLLKMFMVDEPVTEVRANIKRHFSKFGKEPLDPKVANVLIFKGQSELDEALAQWKTRTHILRYVYDDVYKPHLARAKMAVPRYMRSNDFEEDEFDE